MVEKKNLLRIIGLISILLFLLSCNSPNKAEFEQRIKISLREIGNQLLLSNQDSTSLVLPIKKLDQSSFQLEFEINLTFDPDKLVEIVGTHLKKFEFLQGYRVEVIQSSDGEVAYSYEISNNEENTLIPCAGRKLPFNNYRIEFQFLDIIDNRIDSKMFLLIGTVLFIGLIGLFIYFKRNQIERFKKKTDFIKVGNFHFYQEQNVLVREAVEIPLSKKECELLSLLIAKPNQVITREELTKKVWEDNGVIVGRSLDTFISKLRKKLSTDDSLAIENVHGVGYKLVVSN